MTSYRLEDAVEFAENPEPRCPCVLLLDVSGSMQGEPLDALQEGLSTLRFDLTVDPVAARRVELAVIAFNDRVTVMQDFIAPDLWEPPVLTADGNTHMGTAVLKALEMVEARKAAYRAYDVGYYRPWIFLITDGEPQGEPASVTEQGIRAIREAEAAKRVAFFAVGVEKANLVSLARFGTRTPIRLKGLNFREMFVWLSRSIQSVAHSRPGDPIALPTPTGWAEL